MKSIKIGSETIKAKELNSFFSQGFGLMFQKPKPVIMNFKKQRKQISVHMLFCFWPLDLVFLDNSKTVVETKKGLKPFLLYSSKNSAQYLIELPHGWINQYSIKPGQKLIF